MMVWGIASKAPSSKRKNTKALDPMKIVDSADRWIHPGETKWQVIGEIRGCSNVGKCFVGVLVKGHLFVAGR